MTVRHRVTCYKVKVIPQEAEEAQGVPGGLRPRIFLTFGTTRVVGRQPYAPAAFTPGEFPDNTDSRFYLCSHILVLKTMNYCIISISFNHPYDCAS